MSKFRVFLSSDEYGVEDFPRETLDSTMKTLKRLIRNVQKRRDGIDRKVGVCIPGKKPRKTKRG